MIIYMTINRINGKMYIGRDLYNNPLYLGSGILLKKSIKKYGRENFIKIILGYCENEDELNEKEKYFINLYNAVYDENFYNLVDGGKGGFILKECDEELKSTTYSKISASKLNVRLSDEHICKIKEGMSKYTNFEKINRYDNLNEKDKKSLKVGSYNNFYGKTHIGDLKRFGKHRKNVTPTNAIKILNISTNIKYDSLTEASKEFDNPNTARRAISAVCKGKREYYKKMKFKFLNK